MDFETVWKRILENEGQTFNTIRGHEFTYRIHGNSIHVFREGNEINQNIGKNNFRNSLTIWPVNGPTALNVRGHSYIWGMLNDKRIYP